MELKPNDVAAEKYELETSNCTNMELKRNRHKKKLNQD